MIAEIFQKTSTGKKPTEMFRKVTLLPLPEPQKEGVYVNVRPIILLSSLRETLSMCMINRCWDHFHTSIPSCVPAIQIDIDQAYTIKTLVEKGITSYI